MTQTLLELDTRASGPADRVGFDIGWDHAQHAVVPPAELMLEGTPVAQGWHAGRAVFGSRGPGVARVESAVVKGWLDLRLTAWRAGAAFDARVTPQALAQRLGEFCPVTRSRFDAAAGNAPVFVRLDADQPFAPHTIAALAPAAAEALAGRSVAVVIAEAERLQRDPDARHAGLSTAEWQRLATLASFTQTLAPVQAARRALRVLPPLSGHGVQPRSPAQLLQATLTRRLHAAGWSRRARAIADLLPRAELRHDFNLLVGALAVPLLQVPAQPAPHELRWALEDAWADTRVQRRWAQFAVQLSAADCSALLMAMGDAGLTGVHARALQRAMDGAALAEPDAAADIVVRGTPLDAPADARSNTRAGTAIHMPTVQRLNRRSGARRAAGVRHAPHIVPAEEPGR